MNNIDQLETGLCVAAANLRANTKLTSSEACMPVLGVIFISHSTNRYDNAVRAIEADQAAGRMRKRPLVKQHWFLKAAIEKLRCNDAEGSHGKK